MIPHIFELIPILLAIIAAFSCSYRFKYYRRTHDRIAMLISTITSLLLIIAQTSWWVSSILDGNLLGTTFANHIWVIFDSLAMICLIMYAQPWRIK